MSHLVYITLYGETDGVILSRLDCSIHFFIPQTAGKEKPMQGPHHHATVKRTGPHPLPGLFLRAFQYVPCAGGPARCTLPQAGPAFDSLHRHTPHQCWRGRSTDLPLTRSTTTHCMNYLVYIIISVTYSTDDGISNILWLYIFIFIVGFKERSNFRQGFL